MKLNKLFLVAAISAASTLAHAATYQWDINGATAGLGGTGTWNTTNTFWDEVGVGADDGTQATTAYTFTNADTAVFGGTAGVVTLGVTTTVNGLQFNTTGYSITGANILTLDGTTPTITTAAGVTATISSNLAGTAGFTKTGAGTLTINTNSSNTITGTININEGKLSLVNTTVPGANTNKLATTSVVALGGGTLEYIGQDSGYNQIQDLAGLTINAGSSVVQASQTGSAAAFLRFNGNMTRSVGGTVNILSAGAGGSNGAINTLGTTTNTNGIAGGFATANGNTWAVYGGATNTAITGLATFSTNIMSAGTQNVDVTTSFTATGNAANSVRFNNAGARTLTLQAGAATTITTGGILVTSTVGNNASVITGGTSLAGAAGQDLIVHQNNSANTLTIATAIVDNTTATGLTKSGAGSLVLSAANTYTGSTYVNAGTLNLTNTGSLKFVIGASGVNNVITGIGTLTLDGAFVLDLAGAAATGTWQLVDNVKLTESYGSNFLISGFTDNADNTWTTLFNGSTFTFNESTGALTAVPEPSTYGLIGAGALAAVAFVRRRRKHAGKLAA